MRAFIGLEVPDSARRALSGVRAGMDGGQEATSGLRWTRPDNLHLTVRFLGDVDESFGDVLISRLRGQLRQHPPLRISLNAVSWFPARRPLVLAAMAEATPQLSDIIAMTEKECVNMGLPRERRKPNPHVTLARIRSLAGRSLPEIRSDVSVEFDCRELILYVSRLLPTGAQYTHFGEIALGG